MSLNTTAVRIKVTLKDVKPAVMRCLVVPITLRLDRLHRLHLTLQAAFGWTDSHLFEFLAGEGHWGIPDPDGDFGPQPIDARKARLCDIVQEGGARRSTISMTSATGYPERSTKPFSLPDENILKQARDTDAQTDNGAIMYPFST